MRKFLKKLGDCIYVIIIAFLLTVAVQHTFAAAVHIDSANVSVDATNIEELNDGASVKDALDGLYVKAAARESATCPSYYTCIRQKNTPDVGDYIQMTPTITRFTTDRNKTGYLSYLSTSTIYPSRVNMWRVIRKNSDGTIEIVSAEPTPETVAFATITGYVNYIGYLNVLASKYENSKYTIGSRHMGYSNQTEYITDTSKLTTSESNAWTCATGESCHPENQENLGGGDFGYVTDYNLLKNINAISMAKDYYVASRYVDYGDWFECRTIEDGLLTSDAVAYWSSGKLETSFSEYSLRPILILKAGISYTPAAGVADDPFILE